ncbi:MAG: YgiT-type zinc finger protein [Sphaerospermopsis kisseleviana]
MPQKRSVCPVLRAACYSWDAIPAWVCEQCGESLFEAREVELIQEALTVLDRETEVLVSS